MMKLGRDVLVIDPSEWLPGHGETTVDVVTEGRELSVSWKWSNNDDA